MFSRLEKALRDLKERQSELAHSVLKTPPPDYATFRQVVGEYKGIEESIYQLTTVLRGTDDVQDRA